ncbi:MAG: ROK family protein [Thermoleophilia bacterium]|nr:ROK family protein [Thermoleophilia bacterium]
MGGTKCLGVALDADGGVTRTARVPTPATSGELVDALAGIVAELGPASSVGVGMPGLVTHRGGLVASAHLRAMAGLAVADALEPRIGMRPWVANDATCATAAEWRLGAARGCDDVVMVTLGTGIGGGVVTSGRLVTGRNGFAGEFGHMTVDPDGPPCPCGRRGCWERFASGTGLARLARDAAWGGGLRDVVASAGGDVQAVRGEHVQEAARAGDPDALAVVDEFARWVALGMANLTNALDPAAFVLGGGLAAGADLYLEPVRAWFARLLYATDLRPPPDIRVAALGERAGAVGAALLGEIRRSPGARGAPTPG